MAEQSQEAASDAIDAMGEVDTAAANVEDDIQTLQERMEEIDEVVTVIQDIAEQTNLLALNASIEAARAGEAGEGFAVVADEIKTPAEETQEQAVDIEEMASRVKSDTKQTVESIDQANDSIDNGSKRSTMPLTISIGLSKLSVRSTTDCRDCRCNRPTGSQYRGDRLHDQRRQQ